MPHDHYIQTYLETLYKAQQALWNETALSLYVPPQLKQSVNDTNLKDAADTVDTWLAAPKEKVLLLLGDSGAGKTLFSQWLAKICLERLLKGETGCIPLYITLLLIEKPETDLVETYVEKTLKLKGDTALLKWLQQQPLLLLLDGFDELPKRDVNLYRSNHLYQLKDSKVLMSCRSQALANVSNYHQLFHPWDSERVRPDLFIEWTMAPFDDKQIAAYITQYVSSRQQEIKENLKDHPHAERWLKAETYQQSIQSLVSLKEFITSPFVLSLVMEVLPTLSLQAESLAKDKQLQMTRLKLYECFTERWFIRQKKKLLDAKIITDEVPIEVAYASYSRQLAEAMLSQGLTCVSYDAKNNNNAIPDGKQEAEVAEKSPWSWLFHEREVSFDKQGTLLEASKEAPYTLALRHIRAGCPLMQLGSNQWSFLHKSLLEYFAARDLFEGVLGETSVALGCSLNEKLLTQEPDTLRFVADRLKQDEALQQRLFDILKDSKFDARMEIAAANAITLLNYAGVVLTGRNFRGIRIPQADLSGVILDGCDFREADVRGVNFQGASLTSALFSGALMRDIQLGQRPKLRVGSKVNSVVYAPQGEMLAMGCGDGTVQLWQAGASTPWQVLKGHTFAVNSVSFSPDGMWLASGGYDKTVQLWEVKTGAKAHTLTGHTDHVTSVSFSPDGVWLASGSWDNTVQLWAVKTGARSHTLTEHTERVTSVSFSPDGLWLASGGWDNTVQLWAVKTGEKAHTLRGHTLSVNSVSFSPDGVWLASGSVDDTVQLWEVKTGARAHTLTGHTSEVRSVNFSPDGAWLAAGSDDKTVQLWEVKTGAWSHTLNGHTERVTSVNFSPDGAWLASGSEDKTVQLWAVKTGAKAHTLTGHTSGVRSVSFSPDGVWLASGSKDETVRLWAVATGKKTHTLTGHTWVVKSVSFSPDGVWLASGSGDRTVQLWEVATRKKAHTLTGHRDYVMSVSFSPDGAWLASASYDNTVQLWEVKTGARLHTLTGHTSDVMSVSFSPDGVWLASGSGDNTVQLWAVKTGAPSHTLTGHTSGVRSVSFSPDGEWLASGSEDKTVQLWAVKTGAKARTLSGHTFRVMSVSFSPDGAWLASGSKDKTVQLWEAKTGNRVAQLSFKHAVSSLGWHSQGYFAVATGHHIECGQLKGTQFLRLWRSQSYLTSQATQLGGAVGIEESNHLLLTQEGGSGKPSTKSLEDILKRRKEAALPYDPKRPPYSLFTQKYQINPAGGVVSLVRKIGADNNHHVFLVIETIEDKHYLIRQADFYLDKRQTIATKLQFFTRGTAVIELIQKPYFEMQNLLAEGVQARVWQVEQKDIEKLLKHIAEDQQHTLAYSNYQNEKFHAHSCITWCDEKLQQIGIAVPKSLPWLDVLVALPHVRFVGDEVIEIKPTVKEGKSTSDNNNNNANNQKFFASVKPALDSNSRSSELSSEPTKCLTM